MNTTLENYSEIGKSKQAHIRSLNPTASEMVVQESAAWETVVQLCHDNGMVYKAGDGLGSVIGFISQLIEKVEALEGDCGELRGEINELKHKPLIP